MAFLLAILETVLLLHQMHGAQNLLLFMKFNILCTHAGQTYLARLMFYHNKFNPTVLTYDSLGKFPTMEWAVFS